MGEQVAAGFLYGGVAQLGEHLPCKQGVKSSNLSISIYTKAMRSADSRGTSDYRVSLYLENYILRNIKLNRKI